MQLRSGRIVGGPEVRAPTENAAADHVIEGSDVTRSTNTFELDTTGEHVESDVVAGNKHIDTLVDVVRIWWYFLDREYEKSGRELEPLSLRLASHRIADRIHHERPDLPVREVANLAMNELRESWSKTYPHEAAKSQVVTEIHRLACVARSNVQGEDDEAMPWWLPFELQFFGLLSVFLEMYVQIVPLTNVMEVQVGKSRSRVRAGSGLLLTQLSSLPRQSSRIRLTLHLFLHLICHCS